MVGTALILPRTVSREGDGDVGGSGTLLGAFDSVVSAEGNGGGGESRQRGADSSCERKGGYQLNGGLGV